MSIFLKLVKFVIVGASGLVVDFGLTWLFKEKLRVQKYIANAIGFMCAATSNYFLNRIWTFESHNPNVGREYGEFVLVSVIGLGINSLFLWLFVSKAKLNFYVSKFVAIVITTIWNFIANYYITFA